MCSMDTPDTQFESTKHVVYSDPTHILFVGLDSVLYSLKLVSLASGSQGGKLVSQTDSKNGFHLFIRRTEKVFGNVVNRDLAHLRVSGSVAQEKSVERLGLEIVIPRDEINARAAIHKAANLKSCTILYATYSHTYSIPCHN